MTLARIVDLSATHNTNSIVFAGEIKYNKTTDRSLAVYAYENKISKKQVFAIWADEAIPTNENRPRNIGFTILNGNFEKPVLVDVISGDVYEIQEKNWQKRGTNYIFKNIPVYDAPILIADKSLVMIR